MKYKIISENPIDKMEEILINKALPLVIEGKSKEEVEKNISPLIVGGLLKLRNSGQKNKKIYESYLGCIYALLLNNKKIDIKYKFAIFEPEDDSYDFLIVRILKNPHKEEKIISDTKYVYYDSKSEHKVELTEVFKVRDIRNVILKKFNPEKDYKGRILLVVIHNGILDLKEISNWILNYQQTNFKNVCLCFQDDLEKKIWIYVHDIRKKNIFRNNIELRAIFKNIIKELS